MLRNICWMILGIALCTMFLGWSEIVYNWDQWEARRRLLHYGRLDS